MLRDLDLTIDAGRSLVAQLDVELVLQRLLETARELTGARYAALGVLDARAREHVFARGANVIMRKVTPEPYKSMYEIYPAALGNTEIERERRELEDMIRSLGRTPL